MLYRTLCFIGLLLVSGFAAADTPRDLPKISARAWVMMDINSGYLLSKNNEYLPLHPGDGMACLQFIELRVIPTLEMTRDEFMYDHAA